MNQPRPAQPVSGLTDGSAQQCVGGVRPSQREQSVKAWLSARELAGLPGLPASRRKVHERAKREGWANRRRRANGGERIEYAYSSLPDTTRAHLEQEAMEQIALPINQPDPTDLVTGETARLKAWQRERMAARLVVLQFWERLAHDLGLSRERALAVLVERARNRELPVSIQSQVERANAHGRGKGGGRLLSRRTLLRWKAEHERGLTHLAPKARPEGVPIWARPLLGFWQQPGKPSLAEALRELHASGLVSPTNMPSYDAARRFMQRLGAIEKQRGRMLPRELRSLRPYVRRDTSDLMPGDVYVADGHTFDSEIAHPIHGRPFRPEVTLIVDAASRRPVGWAVTIAENALAVVDALRHAVTRCGIPAIFYADRGPGYKNEMLEEPAIGFAARLGITVEHSRPQNPQAHGIVERAHQTIWVRLARKLPTYIGSGMDREARQRAYRATRKGELGVLPSWQDFCRLMDEAVANYSGHPHRTLPKITDLVTGKRRHMTPLEAWNAGVAQGGAPEVPAPEICDDLFRPQTWRVVQRGQVSLLGNTYFSPGLEEYHGRRVAVGYDVWDAHRVWVRDEDGRLLAVAQWDANKQSYFPKTVVDAARERRERGRLKRLERARDEVLAEAQGELPMPEPEPLSPEEQQAAAAKYAELTTLPSAVAAVDTAPGAPRPVFRGEFAERDWGLWVANNLDRVDAQERAEFYERLESPSFRLLIGWKEDVRSAV